MRKSLSSHTSILIGRKAPNRANNRPWTGAEEKHLADLQAQGKPSKEIAALLGRTQDAVRHRLSHLGLRLRSKHKHRVVIELPFRHRTKLKKLAAVKQISLEAAVGHALSIVLGQA